MHDPFYDLFPPSPRPPWRPGAVALMTIDMQYMDAHPDGWMGRLARACGHELLLAERYAGIAAALPKIRRLQDAFRSAGQEVLHVRIAYLTADGPAPTRVRMPALHVQPIAREPRDDEILPEVAPTGDELVFSKTSSSVFSTTDVERVLRNLGVDHLVLTGLVTDGCVELSARDAADRGWHVTVVEDATCASTVAAHVDAIERMTDGGFIACCTSAEAVAQVGTLASDRTDAGSAA